MSKQYIYDEAGKPQFVVLPVAEYERLLSASDGEWETIPVEADEHDDETIPHDVAGIMIEQEVSLQAAWRIWRGSASMMWLSSWGPRKVRSLNWSVLKVSRRKRRVNVSQNCMAADPGS